MGVHTAIKIYPTFFGERTQTSVSRARKRPWDPEWAGLYPNLGQICPGRRNNGGFLYHPPNPQRQTLQGHLAHKKSRSPQDHRRALEVVLP